MKNAFTVIEVIFIIIIVSILSSIFISKLDTKDLLKGVYIIARDLEYTKHLAIIYDITLPSDIKISTVTEQDFKKGNVNLIRQMWGMKFYDEYKDGKITIKNPNYIIYKNTFSGKPTITTLAIDYMDKGCVLGIDSNKKLFTKDIKTSKRLDIKKTYGINNVEFLGSCSGVKQIFFDSEGVPYANSSLRKLESIKKECVIRFSSKNDKKCIVIYPQSGYIAIKDRILGINCDKFI